MSKKHFENTVDSYRYVIYAPNPEPCEPEILFALLEHGEWIWTGNYATASHYTTLVAAAGDFAILKDIFKTMDLNICKISTTLNTIMPSEYYGAVSENKLHRILNKLTEDDVEFLRDGGYLIE